MQLSLPDSLWAATAAPAPDTNSLHDDMETDVAIIGGGFTGLRAALELSQAGISTALLEAGDIGWGASGRNGGQVNPIGHEAPQTIISHWQKAFGKIGRECAERFATTCSNSATELFTLIRKYNIQCDAEQNGWLRGVHGKAAQTGFDHLYQGWLEAGAELYYLDQFELKQLTGSTSYLNGWLAPQGGSVQPLSYARGLAHQAILAGAKLFTQTSVKELTAKGDRWALSTSKGSVTANRVILCTNGYSDAIWPGLKQSVVPAISIQGATQVLTEQQMAEILPDRHTFADTRRVIFYFRKTAENRLVFGSAGVTGENPTPSDRQRIIKGLRTVYPQFPELEPEYLWGGRIALTQDHVPHLHEPAPGILTGLGYNGRGVAMASVMGRILAERTQGAKAEELPFPISPIKPYPLQRFHRAGISILVPWMEFQDRAEAKSSVRTPTT